MSLSVRPLIILEKNYRTPRLGEVGLVLPDSKRGGAHPDIRAAGSVWEHRYAAALPPSDIPLSPPHLHHLRIAAWGTPLDLGRAGLDRAKVLHHPSTPPRGIKFSARVPQLSGAKEAVPWVPQLLT